MAEWGLQAIIRPNQYDHQQDDCFGSIDIKKEYDQALLFCFPHLFENNHHDYDHATTTTNNMQADDLNQLYKPFYSVPPPPAASADAEDDIRINRHRFHDPDQETQRDQAQEIKKFSGSASNTSQLAPKLKKRKNQQKRVVVQVTAAGLSSDPWAWRKYGQKPIKGSIYPRSYYRCSSSKACMARRQVEQSCTDSSIYILTYTAEHNHPQPTRRNSLAGINRNRVKVTPKSPTNSSDFGKTLTKSKGSQVHSPTTISASSSMEDEVLQQSNIKEETTFYNKCDINQGHDTMMMPEINDEECMVFGDDFFEGLEDLGGESSSYYSSNKQFPNVFC
ncbi:putative transcription factor WRKY family [Helianthus annuus]|uniref:Putative WRKY domain-containing protein n=3 Tax=Helianthus annuus TaxID=4232 RepID=A0A251RKR8_HELAN|nr:probable WRKY transcription factor 29 [Helianthus annuus]KAF5753379.1 putative transcription factor WRKY family [Helianthus annuus]KAJ0445753.1 putative transcription factor WRKY family [Helianthus annuus]KAJ0824216.1 putative transcription factor WRKY family [Helianthus annuus]